MDIVSLSEQLEKGDVKGLIVDVDGTLYRQSAVRYRMLARLLLEGCVRPGHMSQAFRALQAYRHAQESMRENCPECDSLAQEQIRVAGRSCGLPEEVVAMHVRRWMETSPLDLLLRARRQDVINCLYKARQYGLRLAVWSDYPSAAKLEAMGIGELFDAVVCAQDADVQRFKPDPRGLEVALARLGVHKRHAVFIGDRPEVDGVAAIRGGVRFVAVGRSAGA